MKISWGSFVKHPLFGIGFHMSQNTSTAESVGIGQHCEIVDLLAKYGTVGLSINIWLLRNFYLDGFWDKKIRVRVLLIQLYFAF